MKKILILILLVIVLIFAYNKYDDYQRYHPKNTDYKISEVIDNNYHNQDDVYSYFESVEQLNSFVTLQWSTNKTDVLHPENDDIETKTAVSEYSKKLAKVKFYEAKLEASKSLKDKGLSNSEIKQLETVSMSFEAYQKKQESEAFKNKMLNNFPNSEIRRGQKSAYIYEIQKLLIASGYDIPLNGVFQTITADALKAFEEKNKLFVDGKLDKISLEVLLNQ